MLSVSPMRLEHIPAVARLERLCFSLPWSERTLRDGLENPQWIFYVAILEENGNERVVGYGGMMTAADEFSIANIAVDPEFRRRGAATAVLQRLILRARDSGGSFITLEVRESNKPAISLYEKLGFSYIGKRKNFYERPREDGLIYTMYFKEERHADTGH